MRVAWLLVLPIAVACGSDVDGTPSTSSSSSGGGSSTSGVGGPSSSSSGGGLGAGGSAESPICPEGSFGAPLEGNPQAVVVSDGYNFLEGPVWFSEEGVLLFSNMEFAQSGPDGWPPATIFRLTPPATVDVFLDANGNGDLGVNGLGIDQDGLLVACTHDERSISRINPTTFARTTVADRYQGDRFNSPNDNVVRSDGTTYFTDPTWQLGNRPQETNFKGVYRIAPNGDVLLVADDFGSPNGIALSPEESVLYVADDQNGHVRSFDVMPDGSTSGGAVFASTPGADGMAVDCAGNLYVTVTTGIAVISPNGIALGNIDTPLKPSNATFGGPSRTTLYITARDTLYRAELAVPGLP